MQCCRNSHRTGYAEAVHHGVIRTGAGAFTERLGIIFADLRDLIQEYQPAEVAVETVFVSRNPASALKLGQARGAAVCAAISMGLPVAEYSPRSVKQAIVGRGGATPNRSGFPGRNRELAIMGQYRLLVIGLVSILLAGCDLASLPLRSGGGTPESTAVTSGTSALAQAREELAAGELGDSIRLYQAALGSAQPGSTERSEALYGLALARISATGKVRDLDRARQHLQTLLKEDPAYARRVEASVLVSLLDDLQRERSRSAAAKRALSQKESELSSAQEQLQSKEKALANLRRALR